MELVCSDMYETFGVHTWGRYGYFIAFIDEYSRFIYIYIGNPMPLINSLNLRRNWITYWVNKLIHFNYIELAYLVGSIVSIGAWDYILVVCTYDSIIK